MVVRKYGYLLTFACTVYKKTGPACSMICRPRYSSWSILHFASLVSPQEAYSSGNTAESGFPVKIRSLLSELPWRQLSTSPRIYWGNLHWCNIWGGGRGSWFHSGWKPAICFQVSTGRLGTAHFFYFLHYSQYPDSGIADGSQESLRLFFHCFHGQLFTPPLSLSNSSTQLLVQMGSLCWFLLQLWI